MKKYILSFIIAIPFVFGVQAQVQVNYADIMPENNYYFDKDDNPLWYDNSTTFYNYQGNLLMFTFVKEHNWIGLHRAYLHVYVLDSLNETFINLTFNGAEKIAFNYPDEEGYYSNAAKIMYRAHAFEYNGQVWYHAFIRGRDNYSTYYDCYAQLPFALDETKKYYRYYNKHANQSKPPDFAVTKGAMQTDDNITFFAYNPSTNYWAKIIATLNSDNKFHNINFQTFNTWELYPELGGVIMYYDNEGNKCFAFNTYDPQNSIAKLAFYKDYPINQWYGLNNKYIYCPASTIIKGTLNGNRNTVYGGKEKNERFTFFHLNTQDNPKSIHYQEYCIKYPGFNLPQNVASGKVAYPTSKPPSSVNGDISGKGYYLYSTYNYIPKTYTVLNKDPNTGISAADGLQQELWIIYPYKDNTVNSLCIESDIWRPDMNSVVKSTDLDKDSDSVYGEPIRGLWTLTGILDGAPPCSIDWDVWYPNNPLVAEATYLTFSQSQGTETSVSFSTKDQYSIGQSLSFSIEGIFNVKEKMNYANAFETKTTTTWSTTTEITREYVLRDSMQTHGFFCWTVPQIQRTSYQVYPWWDDNLIYPIDSTLQYMFRTYGLHYLQDTINLSKYPFLVNNPNGTDMADWLVTNRQGINNAYSISGVNLGEIQWDPLQGYVPGTSITFADKITSTQQTTSTSSYDITISEDIKIPAVFDIGMSEGYKIEFSTENTTSTTIGTSLVASLENLDPSNGINVPKLDLNVLWFQPDTLTGWWFYDSLDAGQYPWYIAYAIVTTKAKIELLAPVPDKQIKESDLLFSWKSLHEKLTNFKIFVGTSPYVSPPTIIYEEEIGNNKMVNPNGFHPEKGKAYYWIVSGVASTGETVWSKTQSFTIMNEMSENLLGVELKAIVYPNPVNNDQVSVSFDTPHTGMVTISLFDLGGRFLYKEEVDHKAKVVSTVTIPITGLTKGIYPVVIQSGTSIITKKLVIMNTP